VGDRYVVEHMRANGFNVGGEQSGHIVLSDFSTTGDGLLAALQVLAEVKRRGKPVSEVCALFTPLPQVLKNVKFKAGAPLQDKHVRTRSPRPKPGSAIPAASSSGPRARSL
jgi:phosphoglucosamine mutase